MSDAMSKHLPSIKEKLFCGYTDCPAVVSLYENHFLREVKRKCPAFSNKLCGNRYFSLLKFHCLSTVTSWAQAEKALFF